MFVVNPRLPANESVCSVSSLCACVCDRGRSSRLVSLLDCRGMSFLQLGREKEKDLMEAHAR